MPSRSTSRRSFLKTSAAAAAVGSFTPAFPWSHKAFANAAATDRPRLAQIGVGGMGSGDARAHSRFADILAVCDVDARHAERAKHDENIGKGKADAYDDYRRVLERDDIDVVSIGTPDHWHVKIAVEALQAGKQVFCQKPLTLTLEENELIRNACSKYSDQVFFIGTQQRSDRDRFLRAVNMVQKGLLGDIKKITVGIDGAEVGGPFATETPPAELDWNAWQGQTQPVDYIPNRCHNNFRWWYEYSGGKFTDWGAHHVDIALWAINRNGPGQGPVEIDGTDAKHPVPYENGYATVHDSYNASHDFNVPHHFADGVEMVVTSRATNGVLFEGSRGRMFVSRGRITGLPIEEGWDEGQFGPEDLERLYKGKPFEGHKSNFYRCLREGGLPVSDVYTHLQAMAACHLTTIAARLGRKLQWDPQQEQFVGDDQANSFLARERREGYDIPRV